MKGQREVVWGRKEEGDFVIKSRQTECSLVYLWRYWLGPFYLSGPAGLLRYPPDLFSNFKYCHFFFIFRRIELAVQYCVVFRIQRLWRKEKEKKQNYDLFSFPAPAHPSVFVGPSSISFMPTGWLPQHAHGWFQLFEKSFSFLSFFFFSGGFFLISLRQFAKLVSWFLLLFLCGQVFYLFDLIVVYHQQKTYSASRIPFLINSLS